MRRLDLVRGDDRRVLVVRRLSVSVDDPLEARRALDELRRRAARPALGPVDPRAEAVEFSDEAEALRCLSEDLADGVARHRWWWRDSLPAGDAGEALTTAWLRSPHWLPAALGPVLREHPELAVAMVSLLTPEQVARVVAAIVTTYVGDAGDAGDAVDAQDRTTEPTAAREHTALKPAPACVPESDLPAGPPATRLLLGLVRLLDERPASVSGLRTWVEQAVRLASAIPTSPEAPTDPVRPVPAPDPLPTLRLQPSAPEPPHPAADPRDEERPPGPGREPVVAWKPRRRTPPTEPADRSWRHAPWAGSGPSIHSELATMLFSVNLVRRFGLDRLSPASADAATGWAVVEALSRWLLRTVPPPRRRTLLADPLLQLLADLDGRPADRRTPVRLGAVRPVRQFLTERRIGVDTFTQPGEILVSRTHVDVVLDLDRIDLAARSAGLDQDPGWVPSLGRVVLFHFEQVG